MMANVRRFEISLVMLTVERRKLAENSGGTSRESFACAPQWRPPFNAFAARFHPVEQLRVNHRQV
jgi:hypothetical protein